MCSYVLSTNVYLFCITKYVNLAGYTQATMCAILALPTAKLCHGHMTHCIVLV